MRLFLLLFLLLLGLASQAAQLDIQLNTGTHSWSSQQLLSHPQARDIEIAGDVAYKRTMHYRAVPLNALLEGVATDDHLQAVAADGFAAELPAAPLLANQGSQAWLAVEDPVQPWPALGKGKPSAGPFYLVWTDPAASRIGPEQWPFQIVRFRQLSSVEQRFPALLPAADADTEVLDGFAQFQKNCLACHRLNSAGDSAFGPDLNIPYNPTEYFTGNFLRQYIRDPQNLRKWPQGRMPGFNEQALNEVELEQLIAYLAHMAQRKVTF